MNRFMDWVGTPPGTAITIIAAVCVIMAVAIGVPMLNDAREEARTYEEAEVLSEALAGEQERIGALYPTLREPAIWRATAEYRRTLRRYSEAVRKYNFDWESLPAQDARDAWIEFGCRSGHMFAPLPPPEKFLPGT